MDDIDEYYSQTYEQNPLLINGSTGYFSQDYPSLNSSHSILPAVPHNEINSTFKVYRSRWWILFIFMLLSLNQCNFWITFGTVAPMATQYYQTTLSAINWLSAIGPLLFIPFSVCFSWSINRYGIRKNVVCASALSAAGGIIRSISTGGERTFFLIVIGQMLNSLAGPCIMIIPTKISTTWFAPEERTLSTAIGTLANFSGSAIGFVLALVCTSDMHLRYLLYSEAVFGFLIFLSICIYFPEKPPTPPSATSYFSDIKANHKQLLSDSAVIYSEKKTLFESWKELFVNSVTYMTDYSAAILTISVALVSGFYAGWSAVLVEIVEKIYTQEQAKWLGFYGIIAGLVGGVLMGMLHDRIHNFKSMLLILFALNTVTYLLFTLLVQGYLPNWYWLCQVFNVSGGFFINGFYPIIYEAAVEVTYPIPESIGTSIISILLNVVSFTAIMVSNAVPSYYLNWILVALSAFSFVILCFVKENYKRSKNDNLGSFEQATSTSIASSIIIPNI
ncbi:hypothetical protein DLAC_03006 [Tieghemostelium lacteum]|uniref:Major facilitator superfamily (MFS) profile domain-containing protein n=1 Tax=Tieghemostelium lacteum TaxID=361077 RepID=A0A152A4F4_TIELA|nr:hypothetical protein DLAC_03006 [Tieghemostelium lacteum]|eukprot:KYR00941.1 hypothetical protein DLAC_03006 [Tieghemostelium lacteum]